MRKDVTKKIAYLNYALFKSLSRDPAGDETIDFEEINKWCRDKDAKIKTHAEDPKETPQHTICMQHFNVYIYAGKKDVWAYVYIEPLVGDIVKCVPPRSAVYVWMSQEQVEKLVETLSIYMGQ